jgi:hypothetical protein
MLVISVQLLAELKNLQHRNDDIRYEMNRCNHDLHKYDDKLQILDNMTQLATQSLEVYFQAVGRRRNERAVQLSLIFIRFV